MSSMRCCRGLVSAAKQSSRHIFDKAISPEGHPSREKEDKDGIRSLPFLGAALIDYTEGGLWPQAVESLIAKILPPGCLRDHAISRVGPTMKKYGKGGSCIVSVSFIPHVVRDVMTPGVDMKT